MCSNLSYLSLSSNHTRQELIKTLRAEGYNIILLVMASNVDGTQMILVVLTVSLVLSAYVKFVNLI
jgi:hypothetical protein